MNKRRITFLLYALAILMVGAGVFVWAKQDRETNDKATGTNATVEDISKAVNDIKADHVRQDEDFKKIIQCLANLFVDQNTATKDQVGECTRPVTGISGGIAPSGQANAPVSRQGNQTSGASSSQSIPNNSSQQPDTSQNNDNPQPDNEGVIVDLPLLPPIHIPSPL